jgi:hypothetical protein
MSNEREQVNRLVPEADYDILLQDMHAVTPSASMSDVTLQCSLVEDIAFAV